MNKEEKAKLESIKHMILDLQSIYRMMPAVVNDLRDVLLEFEGLENVNKKSS